MRDGDSADSAEKQVGRSRRYSARPEVGKRIQPLQYASLLSFLPYGHNYSPPIVIITNALHRYAPFPQLPALLIP